MDSDHGSGLDGGPDGVLHGLWDTDQDNDGSAVSSPEEYNNFDEAEMYWLGRNRDSQDVPAPNGGLSAENMEALSNAQAGSSQSHNLIHLNSIEPEGRPSQEGEQMNIRLRGHRSRSSVVSESGLDGESEQNNTRPRGHRSRSI